MKPGYEGVGGGGFLLDWLLWGTESFGQLCSTQQQWDKHAHTQFTQVVSTKLWLPAGGN